MIIKNCIFQLWRDLHCFVRGCDFDDFHRIWLNSSFFGEHFSFLALFVRNDRYIFHLSILAEYALFCLRRYATHNKHLLMLSDAKTLYRKHFFCSFFHFLFAFVVRNDRYKVFLSILALFFSFEKMRIKKTTDDKCTKIDANMYKKIVPNVCKMYIYMYIKWCQMYIKGCQSYILDVH